MTDCKDSEVLALLQPDLLTKEDLIEKIQTRCCRVENLGEMSKERLVGIFRQVISPLPQRLYRTNRRGKILSARRARAGLEGGRKRGKEDAGDSDRNHPEKLGHTQDRLKPPPDASYLRSGSNSTPRLSSDSLDRIVINDRRKKESEREERRNHDESRRPDSSSSRKITLKRPSSGPDKTRPDSPPPADSKKLRTAIRWP